MSHDMGIIQLRDVYLAKMHVAGDARALANKNTAPKPPDGLAIRYDVFIPFDLPHHLVIRLEVRGGWRSSVPVTIQYDVIAEALFEYPKHWDLKLAGRVVRLQGGSMLYGIVRGYLLAATGGCLGGPVRLETVNWSDVVETIEAKQAARAAHEATGAPKRPDSDTPSPLADKKKPVRVDTAKRPSAKRKS